MLRYLTIFFVLIFNLSQLKATDLSLVKDEIFLNGNQLSYFITNQDVDFKVIKGKKFRFYDKEFVTIQNPNGYYWVKIPIKYDYTRKWIFEIITPQTEKIEFYYPTKKGYQKLELGCLLPFKNRLYNHKNFIVDLPHDWDYNQAIYLKIQSSNKVGLLFKIKNQQYFTSYSTNEYFLLGIYYGILMLLILYNLVLYFSIRNKVYILYSLMVISAVCISLADDGLGFQFLWRNYPHWSQTLGLYVFPISFLSFYALYAFYYLQHNHKLKYWILLVSGMYVAYNLSQLFFSNQKIYFSNFYFIPFVFSYTIYLIYYFKHRYTPALFFIIGNSFALMGLLINQLRLLEYIPGNTFTVYAFNVGILLEFVSLSLSLSYQYKLEVKAKQKAQNNELKFQQKVNVTQQKLIETIEEKNALANKINAELEDLVSNRTAELNNLVAKLKDLNLQYDKENWELRGEVKSEKLTKVLGETMSYKEFLKLYPTKFVCMQYLADIKWKKGFACKNCGYDKFSENNLTHERKCSRCGKIHSVTENSLFHGQKTELNKLFYITYLVHQNHDINAKILSAELNISINTLYKFIKHVKEIQNKQKGKKWTEWIFGNEL